MAKTVAEDWANLALNEKVQITVGENTANERIWEVLDNNDFKVRGNQLVELAFALGTGAFIEYKDGDQVMIDYIRAGMIYPLSWTTVSSRNVLLPVKKWPGKRKRFI